MGKSIGKIASVAAPLALSYFAPGLGTALGTGLGLTEGAGAATVGSGLLGGGIGALTGGGLKGALTGAIGGGLGANLGDIANGIGDALGAGAQDAGFGTVAGTPLASSVGPTQGSGLAGALTNGSVPSLGGLTGNAAGGGGSSFNAGGALANAIGGIGQQDAIAKAQKQLLASNKAQQANIGTFDPSNITNDAGYQFNLQQGQQGLDRQEAADGGLLSGAALKAASQYNQNYANNALNSAYQRYLDQTGATNQLLASQGAINSQGTIAGANGLASTLSGVLNPTSGLSSQDLIKKLLGSQASGTQLYG